MSKEIEDILLQEIEGGYCSVPKMDKIKKVAAADLLKELVGELDRYDSRRLKFQQILQEIPAPSPLEALSKEETANEKKTDILSKVVLKNTEHIGNLQSKLISANAKIASLEKERDEAKAGIKEIERQTIDNLYQCILAAGIEFEPMIRCIFHEKMNALTQK
jgi:hypothetical protein